MHGLLTWQRRVHISWKLLFLYQIEASRYPHGFVNRHQAYRILDLNLL